MTTEELKVIITAEIDNLKKELDAAKKETEKFSKEGSSKLDNFNEAMSSVGSTANKALGIASAAIAGASVALLSLSGSTKEYRENQAKLDTAFQTAGASAETAKNTYNDLYRVLGDDGQATEAAAHLAQLTTNQKDLQQWTEICQGVYATFGDSLPIESLTEAANETAKVGTITGSLADALNWAGISEEEFQAKLDACNTEAEREQLIRETLSGEYDKAAKKYEETAASVLEANDAQRELSDAQAELGETLEPVNTMLTKLGTEILAAIAPYIKDFIDKHGEDLKNLLSGIADAIGTVIGFIADNWEIITTIAAVILAIVAAINLYNAAMAIYNIVMAPVNLTILAIVAAIVVLIAIIAAAIIWWDDIKAAVIACWEGIKKAWDKVVEFFKKAWQGIKDVFKGIGTWFSERWNDIKKAFSAVGSWFRGIFQGAWNGIKGVFSGVGSFFTGIWNKIKSIFSKVGSAIGSAVSNAFSKAINWVLDKAIGIINGFIKAINVAIGIINKIPGVNIKKLGLLSVPKLAEGGVVDSATLAVVGEQGKEAVVPLENNLGWLDKLASMLNERMGGGAPIVLTVDGNVFAKTTLDTLNKHTRQTGSLGLIIQ